MRIDPNFDIMVTNLKDNGLYVELDLLDEESLEHVVWLSIIKRFDLLKLAFFFFIKFFFA